MATNYKTGTIQLIKNGINYELTPADEGGYVIQVVDYPSCMSQGETIDEALAHIEDALLGCLTVDQEEGLEIPNILEVWLQKARIESEEKTTPHQSPTTH